MVATDACVVDVLFRPLVRRRKRTGVGPDDVDVLLVEVVVRDLDPHVVAEEAGLNRVGRRNQVRHRRRRDPLEAQSRIRRAWLRDRRQGDVVAPRRLAVAVVPVVEGGVHLAAVPRDVVPRLPLRRVAEAVRHLERGSPGRAPVLRVRVQHLVVARRGRRRLGARARRRTVSVVGPGGVQVVVPVYRDRHRGELRHAVAVRRQALPAGRTTLCVAGKTGRMRSDQVADAERALPVGREIAVTRRRRWALHHQHLVDPRHRRVAVTEDDVDRAVPPDDRMRALILVAGVRVAGCAAEDGAQRRRSTADDHLGRPGRPTVAWTG